MGCRHWGGVKTQFLINSNQLKEFKIYVDLH